MEEVIRKIGEFFSAHTADLYLFIAGFIGAAMADNRSEVELTRTQRVIRMLFGGATAMLCTQLMVELLESFTNIELSSPALAGVGFFLGNIGLHGITKVIVKYTDYKKDKK